MQPWSLPDTFTILSIPISITTSHSGAWGDLTRPRGVGGCSTVMNPEGVQEFVVLEAQGVKATVRLVQLFDDAFGTVVVGTTPEVQFMSRGIDFESLLVWLLRIGVKWSASGPVLCFFCILFVLKPRHGTIRLSRVYFVLSSVSRSHCFGL